MRRCHLTVLIAITLVTAAWVAAGLPGLSNVPGWFYKPQERGLGEALPLAVGAVTVPALVWASIAGARRRYHGVAVLLLFVASLVAQYGLVLADARGLDAALRWQWEGHGEMARIAHARREQLPDILRHYDAWMRGQKLGMFTPSKPPGALAAYVGVDHLADALRVEGWLGPLVEAARERPKLAGRADTAALAFVLFPALQALAVPLVFLLGALLFGRRVGHAAALLTFTAPVFLLVQQHLDGALYPLLALGVAVLAALGATRDAPWWSALAGGLWGLSLYVSFSLLPVLGLAAGCIVLVALRQGWRGDRVLAGYRAGWHLVLFGAGALLALTVLVAVLDFEPAHRLRSALAYHARWKRGVPTDPWRGWALLEFALYLSVPLAASLVWRAFVSSRRLALEHLRPDQLVPAGMVAFLVLLSIVAGTNEAARLWLFTVPFVAVAVSVDSEEADRRGRWWPPIGWLAACQGVLALVLKANQMW